jgi:hypothetical protein
MKSLGIDFLAAQNMSTLDKWEISRDRVVINRKLGEGAFGMVYGGEALFEDKGWVSFILESLEQYKGESLSASDESACVAGGCSSEDIEDGFHSGGEVGLPERGRGDEEV